MLEQGGQLFRGILPAHAPFCETVLASPAIDNLFALGLVSTERAEIRTADYPLVLRHERIDFVTYWPEWSSLMLRDAALMLCDLNLELLRHGCGILDCHPWNVLFDFTRPVFVDFSAVVPVEDAWLAEMAGRLRNYWVLPLALIARGHPWFARSFRRTPDVGEPVDDLFKHRALAWFPLWYARLRRTARTDPRRFFERLRAALASLPLPRDKWSDGETVCDGRDDDAAGHEVEIKTLQTLLERLGPRTVLDIACHEGRRALVAEATGAKVVAFDDNEEHVNTLYLRARAERRKILPLFLDFTVPTPAHGRKCEFPSAPARLRCDVSLLVGVLERLVFHLDLGFPRVAQLLAAYTARHAIVEFAPRAEGHAERDAHRRDWYNADNFVAAMDKYFRLAGVFDSDPPRKILLFEKR